MSNLILSQNTNLVQLNNVEDIYKGLKQNEFLKKKLNLAEKTITSNNQLIKHQENIISKQQLTIKKQDSLLYNTIYQYDKKLDLKDIEIKKIEYYLNKEKQKNKHNKIIFFVGGFILSSSLLILNL